MGVSWLKTGAESAELAKKQAVEAALAKQEQGKMFRFWLKDGEDAAITFIDGDLSSEGFLLPPRFYEHNLFLNGNYNNHFMCPEKTNPAAGETCPLCEAKDRPLLVALFTIIDHRSYTTNAGKTYKDQRRLLVAKPQSFELLNKIAQKRDGLARARFDVSRQGGDKSAAIGSMFDFVDKKSLDELQGMYMQEVFEKGKPTGKTETYFTPADYDHEIVYRTGDELRAMGLGRPVTGGQVMQGPTQPTAGGTTSYADNL